MKIALVGVDGAGKTTIIKKITENNNNIKIIYMGFRDFKFQNLIDRLGKSKITLFFQHFIVFVENLFRYRKALNYEKDGYDIVFDRYPLIDYQVASKGSYLIYTLFYKYFFPKPDKIILIVGDVDEIYKRKPELTKSEIKNLQAKLKELKLYDNVIFNKTGYLDKTLELLKKEFK